MEKLDNWGQYVLIPSRKEWQKLMAEKHYNGYALSPVTCDFARWDLETFANHPEVVLGLVDKPGRYYYLRMLNIDDVLYRVHFEDVICEHCNKRSGMSATPDFVAYAGATRADEAWEAMLALPVKHCRHCHGPLKRRHTLWFAEP